MTLKFHDIFPGEGSGFGKKQGQPLIQKLLQVNEAPEGRLPGRWTVANHGFADDEGQGAGYSHDANAALARRRGHRGNGVRR